MTCSGWTGGVRPWVFRATWSNRFCEGQGVVKREMFLRGTDVDGGEWEGREGGGGCDGGGCWVNEGLRDHLICCDI
jgi:hypothetical protein